MVKLLQVIGNNFHILKYFLLFSSFLLPSVCIHTLVRSHFSSVLAQMNLNCYVSISLEIKVVHENPQVLTLDYRCIMLRGKHLSNTLLLPFPSSPYRNKTIWDILSFLTSPTLTVHLVVINKYVWGWAGEDLAWVRLSSSGDIISGRATKADEVANKIAVAFYLASLFLTSSYKGYRPS